MLIAFLFAGPAFAIVVFAVALFIGQPFYLGLLFGWLGGCVGVLTVVIWRLVAGFFRSRGDKKLWEF